MCRGAVGSFPYGMGSWGGSRRVTFYKSLAKGQTLLDATCGHPSPTHMEGSAICNLQFLEALIGKGELAGENSHLGFDYFSLNSDKARKEE